MDREIELFWKRKFSGAATLFLANRYTVLVYVTLQSAPISNSVTWTDHVSQRALFSWKIGVKVEELSCISRRESFPNIRFSKLSVRAMTS